MEGKNQSVSPPPRYARAETPAPEVHAGDCIAVVFALPVPIAVLTAPAMFELVSLHQVRTGSIALGFVGSFQFLGAISYVSPPEMRNTSPPPGPVSPSAYDLVEDSDRAHVMLLVQVHPPVLLFAHCSHDGFHEESGPHDA